MSLGLIRVADQTVGLYEKACRSLNPFTADPVKALHFAIVV